MSGRLSGKIALITGAAGGIGAASAALFLAEGATLVLTDIDAPALRKLGSRLDRGGRSVIVAGDLTDESFIASMINAAREAFGGLDIVYNNAGLMVSGALDALNIDDLRRSIDINLYAQLAVVKHAVPLLQQSVGPAVVNTASVGGLLGYANMQAYTASKAAIIGATKALAVELASISIRVNAVAPALVETQMSRNALGVTDETDAAAQAPFVGRQLLKRFARPAEIAEAALFLASDAASFITGVVLPVDGGWSAW